MAGLIRPKNFALRKITDTAQRIGRIFQQRRFPDYGGFTSASKWSGSDEFKVSDRGNGVTTGESEARSRE